MILSAAQRRFLAFYQKADPGRVRARWLGAEGRNLGPVDDHTRPPAGAERVRVGAILTGGIETRGADKAYRILDLAELPGLDGLWRVPLVELNADGLELVKGATEPALTETFRTADRQAPEAFKVDPVTSAWLQRQAKAEGRHKTAIIRSALALYRATFGDLTLEP
ncbi:hypothetical protein [Phenylobacterium sp.]|uniref:hypothetical protein n=1 Tax=Phenylobacterium sp. TaxID=1871053 RepID=UPI0025F8AC20|nr:hypothetical protein [Phenylobacterium sp.]